jgi:hypothetical protein
VNAVWLPPPWQAMAMRVLGMVSSGRRGAAAPGRRVGGDRVGPDGAVVVQHRPSRADPTSPVAG